MDSIIFNTLAAGASSAGGAPQWLQMMPLVLIFVVFYFLILRPQQRRIKDQTTKIAGVKRNDQVVTGGGLVGKVTKVDDDYVEIDLGNNVKVKAVKSTLADIIPPGGAKPAND